MPGGEFDWGGRLRKGIGGAQRSPQDGWKPSRECKGRRRLDCDTDGCNMFVMSSEKTSEYCHWLFSILFELEQRIDITQHDNYQKRVFGFIAERLFNVWILYNQLNVKYLPVVNLDGENLIKKGLNLLKRKFLR